MDAACFIKTLHIHLSCFEYVLNSLYVAYCCLLILLVKVLFCTRRSQEGGRKCSAASLASKISSNCVKPSSLRNKGNKEYSFLPSEY